jgi:HD superfamily phosphodiesterase
MASDKRLAPGEAFILLTAAYLHDIGMQNEQFAGGDIE